MRLLATYSIRQFPLHFPSRASPCATRFRTSSTPREGTPSCNTLTGGSVGPRAGLEAVHKAKHHKPFRESDF